jgi:hypothetical protein
VKLKKAATGSCQSGEVEEMTINIEYNQLDPLLVVSLMGMSMTLQLVIQSFLGM